MKSEQYYKSLVDTITDPRDCIAVALAIETLAYHNKNFLDNSIKDNCDISATIQQLLKAALGGMK